MNARDILMTRFQERRARNPAYSMRAFAASLSVSPGMLSLLLNGKRRLSLRLAKRIADVLSLTEEERATFLKSALVPQESVSWRPAPEAFVDISPEELKPISEWYFYAILGLCGLPTNSADPAWIAARLRITEDEARVAVARLVALGMIERTPRGSLRQITSALATRDAGPNLDLRRMHRQVLERAASALDEQAVDRRDFSAITVPTSRTKIPAAKELLRKFRREFAALVESDAADDVYFLTMQFFAATHDVADSSS